ncbi:MAG: cobalamin biosynthesis protein [Alphaproteobacteria bacterium]|nr:cobalamin biosynthesis protein [Alphaproteobacteria bacterium]MCB9931765.1 cobalamin biosynthesis protein [Alphaproteobacteria bacterium]
MIWAGFGCTSRAEIGSFRSALRQAAGTAAVDGLAGLAGRTLALCDLARELGLPLVMVPPERIAGLATPSRSQASLDAHATGSVAEAVALAAAGPGARLVLPRLVSGDRLATCALAEGAPV